MHVVLPGVGLGTVCVTMAADAHSASSGVSGSHALQTCGAGGNLQRGELGVELLHPGFDSWLVEKRLCRDRRCPVTVSLPVKLPPGCCQVSRSQFCPADVLSGLAVELLSPPVFQPPLAAVG